MIVLLFNLNRQSIFFFLKKKKKGIQFYWRNGKENTIFSSKDNIPKDKFAKLKITNKVLVNVIHGIVSCHRKPDEKIGTLMLPIKMLLQVYTFTAENTVISPNFLGWKFCGKAIRQKICGNCAFPQNFHTRKSGETTVFFAMFTIVHLNYIQWNFLIAHTLCSGHLSRERMKA